MIWVLIAIAALAGAWCGNWVANKWYENLSSGWDKDE